MPSLFLMNFVPIDNKDKYVHFDICHNYQNDIAQGHCVALMIELIKTLSQGKRVS
jgi:leucyl aminopeptidase